VDSPNIIPATDNSDTKAPHRRAAIFWTMIALGAALRVYCVLFTNGTSDMEDWEDHATQVHNLGFVGYYYANEFANHPPFISEVGSLILQTAAATHIPFRILFRGLFALLDGGNALLLFALLPEGRSRFIATAIYWISPAAVLISAHHGNADSAIAFFLLLAIWLATRSRTALSGVAFGMGLWIKVPVILGLPPIITLFRNWRCRLIFLLAGVLAALSTYALVDPDYSRLGRHILFRERLSVFDSRISRGIKIDNQLIRN
jgi:Gpi18-like mannosyltransferase